MTPKDVQSGHKCPWIKCSRRVPAKLWGCYLHWFKLPKLLRDRIWAAYVPGQEETGILSKEYIAVHDAIDAWIAHFVATGKR